MDDLVQALMMDFANSTGVTGRSAPRRYLWTDAFAVCNFLGLSRQSGRREFLDLAVTLVDQVHHVLGRHRNDDSRRGWISGLSEEKGELHPTCGGLRIGKTLNERSQDQPLDSRQEWDRDGQYFHYLTKWMHALHRMGGETGESRYGRWAAELAATAQRSFTRESYPGGPKRMVWKMSIDLSRPLVPSMGQHDPLDGLITCLELQTGAALHKKGVRPPATSGQYEHQPHREGGRPRFCAKATGAGNDSADDTVDLEPAINDLTEMCARGNWATDDPLGIGGLMDAASRLAQMVFERGIERRGLLRQILIDAELSLNAFAGSSLLSHPAERRLAFRELGLSIGIHGLKQVKDLAAQDRELSAMINSLLSSRLIAEQIQDFWSNPKHRRGNTWTDHGDINSVMLATSLAPEGYLSI